MKNALAAHRQEAYAKGYDKGYTEGCFDGQSFGLGLATVALNNLFGFGKDRLKRTEDEINRLMQEEFGGDKEAASYQLAKRIKQIMEGK